MLAVITWVMLCIAVVLGIPIVLYMWYVSLGRTKNTFFADCIIVTIALILGIILLLKTAPFYIFLL